MDGNRVTAVAYWVCLIVLSAGISLAGADKNHQEDDLFLQSASDPAYRTPRAGEGLRAEVFGRSVDIQPRNRRSTSSWDAGLEYTPGLADDTRGIGYLYFWRHPDNARLQRALISLVYNEFLWAQKTDDESGFEFIFTFQNYTPLSAQSELVDGQLREEGQLRWGYARFGAGLGFREHVAPGNQENMRSLDLLIEPGYLFFKTGQATAANFLVPDDTFDLRARLQLRWDALERNLLELPHRGFAAGGDLVKGLRSHWGNWGLDGEERGDRGREYRSVSGYVLTAGGIPGINSERHRLIASLHGGWGERLDRFSAARLGGGQNTLGEEYLSTSDPILPGAARGEFFPRHYLVAFGEYRWEPVFYAFLGLNGSVARLDRPREAGTTTVNRTDTFTSAGVRLTSGFLSNSRIQLAYNYGFSLIRKGERGAHELALHLSKTF